MVATRNMLRSGSPGMIHPACQTAIQERLDIIKNWHRVGVVVQGTAIDGGNYSPDVYLEVEAGWTTPEIRCSRGRTDT
jgi:hypothetical protein